MRKYVKVILLGVALLGGAYLFKFRRDLIDKVIYIYPCNSPTTYRLDKIDPQFNLTQSRALSDIEKAAKIWEKAYGKQLFREDPKGKLAVSFVYDERQQLKSEVVKLEDSLSTAKETLDAKIADYEERLADYKRRAAQLNAEVDSWNKKGGAPINIYNQLNSLINKINTDAAVLNKDAQELNKEAQSFGKSVESLNSTVDTYNLIIDTKPEEGLYDPNNQTITIYIATNPKELISTLAHEFGHALNMNHVRDKESIMYSYANTNLEPSQGDLAELDKVCQRKNLLQYLELSIRSHIPERYLLKMWL